MSQTHRLSGVLLDSRTSKMFYLDAAKNLTRIEDPLNLDAAPTLMEYDGNSNLTRLVDPDNKEMLFQYDYRRRLVRVKNGLAQATEMTFNGRGLLSLVKDANLRETSFLYCGSPALENHQRAQRGHRVLLLCRRLA